tara:strand:- start:436 stop:1518 length:1083 start_codon:yes stop_codon:yes gene_type:complete
MIYLINFIFFLLITQNLFASENIINKVLFKINNKNFTNIDFENRKQYVSSINSLKQIEFSKSENKEILDDYISSLIFYEFYIQNNVYYKNLNDEIEIIYKENFQDSEELSQIEIKNIKFSINIDLVRKKIIEEKLNLKRENLLQEANKLDLLYNYNLQYIIINENLIDNELIKNIDSRKKFNNFKEFLTKNKINFFYKEKDINDNTIISVKIKNIIKQKIQVYKDTNNGYINLISINKNLESYEGIFVKLINFTSTTPFKEEDLQCDKLNETIDISKTVFKEYEYSKLNNNVKNNLKSINDYILFNEKNQYNYIVLCDLNYDEKILKNINFNKNINFLVDKIQKKFLKKYKNEYKFSKFK